MFNFTGSVCGLFLMDRLLRVFGGFGGLCCCLGGRFGFGFGFATSGGFVGLIDRFRVGGSYVY